MHKEKWGESIALQFDLQWLDFQDVEDNEYTNVS